MSAVDVSAVVGLTAMVLLTLNLLLGLLVSTNYSPQKHWPGRTLPAILFKLTIFGRPVTIFRLHNWTAYIAISVVVLHPTILLLSRTAGFRIRDVLWPIHSPHQTLYNTLGALAFYLIVMVVITSYFRSKIGFRTWKALHYFAYLAAAVLLVHGIFIDQNLKDQTPDFFDGEKVLVECCFLIAVAASVWRWRYGSEKQRALARRQRQ